MSWFVDTNVVVYAQSDDPRRKRAIQALDGATISVQVLNELTLVARRRWGRSWDEIDQLMSEVISSCASVVAIDESVHSVGRQLASRYDLAVYDSFIVSAALLSGCDTLYSEDMHHGLVIESALTIRNPFR